MKHIIFLSVMTVFGLSVVTDAAIPSLINYQGRLTDSNGTPVTGSKDFSVSIYDAAINGSLLYHEHIGPVFLYANGTYSFQFGAVGTSTTSTTETIAIADGIGATFEKVLSKSPIEINSLHLSDGSHTWDETAGSSNKEAFGVVYNVSSSGVQVTYPLEAPSSGTVISCSYRYSSIGAIEALSSGGQHWMEISIDGTAETTRQRVLTVPFAFFAAKSALAKEAENAPKAEQQAAVAHALAESNKKRGDIHQALLLSNDVDLDEIQEIVNYVKANRTELEAIDHRAQNLLAEELAGRAFINIKEFGAIGDGVADDTAAIQAALDFGGANGLPVIVPSSSNYYKITTELVIKYPGSVIRGASFNPENKGYIKQTTAVENGIRVALPPGKPSTHNIIIENLRIVGPGVGTSTGIGIDFGVGPVVGNNFSDFNTLRNLRIERFETGLNLTKFSNSTIAESSLFDCNYLVRIGGNCNAVNFNGVQFNTPKTACIFIHGSGYVNLFGCEAGNGPQFIVCDRDPANTDKSIGMSMTIYRLACESFSGANYDSTDSRLYANEIKKGVRITVHGSRWLAGKSSSVIPFKFDAYSAGALHHCGMNDFSHRTLAHVTDASVVTKTQDALNTTGGDIVEVFAGRDNSFQTKRWEYSSHTGQGQSIFGAINLTPNLRGEFVRRYGDDVRGGNDQFKLIGIRNGELKELNLLNSAMLDVLRMDSSFEMEVNKRYVLGNVSSIIEVLLPENSTYSDEIEIMAIGASGKFKITQHPEQSIYFGGEQTTIGSAGYLEITSDHGVVKLKKMTRKFWQVISIVGNATAR